MPLTCVLVIHLIRIICQYTRRSIGLRTGSASSTMSKNPADLARCCHLRCPVIKCRPLSRGCKRCPVRSWCAQKSRHDGIRSAWAARGRSCVRVKDSAQNRSHTIINMTKKAYGRPRRASELPRTKERTEVDSPETLFQHIPC